ncbi:MAG TPA: DUF58 domain-containing protein [Polyangiaceae bacterium]|nr:DUF58 domain-containing protein [Polyangiaceae bacterium]
MTDALLAPEFLRELEILKRRLEIQARSGGAGERVSRRRGSSAEFHEHRPYEPGDDLRRIDWHAFARSGQPVTKLFRAEEDAVVRIVLDASASLEFGTPSKLDAARRVAAAIGYLSLASGQRAELWIAHPTGAGRLPLERTPPRRGRAGVTALLRDLSRVSAGGGTDLSAPVRALVEHAPRPGLVVVVSDFFDAGPVTSALGLARASGHDLALVQILDPTELDPELEGDLSLVDSESGESVEVTADGAAIEAYLLRITGLIEELRAFARRHGATYVRATTDESLLALVRRLVARSID